MISLIKNSPDMPLKWTKSMPASLATSVNHASPLGSSGDEARSVAGGCADVRRLVCPKPRTVKRIAAVAPEHERVVIVSRAHS